MAPTQAPAVRDKRFEIPRAVTARLQLLDRLGTFESPIVQIAVIILAAAMASVVGGTLIRMLADGLAQS